MQNKTLDKVQKIMDKVEDGLWTEAVALAALRTLMAKDLAKMKRNAAKSDLPLGSRMGVAKKGTSHPMRML